MRFPGKDCWWQMDTARGEQGGCGGRRAEHPRSRGSGQTAFSMQFPAEPTLRTAKPSGRELRGGRMLRTRRSVHVNEHILPDLGLPRMFPYPTPHPANQPNASPIFPLPTNCPGLVQAQSILSGEMEVGGESGSDPAPPGTHAPGEACPGAIWRDGGDTRAMPGLWEGCALQ